MIISSSLDVRRLEESCTVCDKHHWPYAAVRLVRKRPEELVA